jgi:two-component system CheB/CheR fusion protein
MAEREAEAALRGVEPVLDFLKETRLFDFTGYKRATLTRRIDKRMQQIGVDDYASYVDYLEVHPEEFGPLFNTILINVTSFFRDPEAWDAVRELVVAHLVARNAETPIRIWSAGCASGQEPYSALMLLAEELGVDGVRDRVKVYATDVDAEALEQARLGAYSARDVDGVPEDLLERYFDTTATGYTIKTDLRRAVIFGRHDLLQDAPISRVDFLLCRNTLMYFNADVQAQLVNRLHFSLVDSGYLFLGKVEMLGHGDLFEPVDQRHRLFQKINVASLRSRLLSVATRTYGAVGADDRLLELAFERHANPEIVLDAAGTVLAVNGQARSLFTLGDDAVGRPFQDLELSHRPIELRSWIDEVRAEGRTIELDEIARWTHSGELAFLDVKIVPIDVDGQHLGVVITWVDVTRHRQLQDELEQTHRELEVAYEELQSANEELETTNEELQSTIEELETTNEELQSTNEELEAMNDELQSTNEELQASNDELRERTEEVNEVNAYMESVLMTMRASLIVVDRDIQIRVWNGLSYEMWGLRADEVEGRGLLGLDIGFPVEVLGPPIRACLIGDGANEPSVVDAVLRTGEHLRCRAQVAPLHGADGAIDGAIVVIEEERAAAQ